MEILRRFKNFSRGYTLAEALVVVSIVTVIMGVVLVGFTGIEGALINSSARDLVVALRRAQNMSLAVTGIKVFANEVPPAVGIRLDKNSGQYIIFGDRTASRNNMYDGASEKIESKIFGRNIVVTSIKNDAGVEISSAGLHILFSSPEASPKFTDAVGADIPGGVGISDRVEIVVRSQGGKQRTIIVRESGQMSIKP